MLNVIKHASLLPLNIVNVNWNVISFVIVIVKWGIIWNVNKENGQFHCVTMFVMDKRNNVCEMKQCILDDERSTIGEVVVAKNTVIIVYKWLINDYTSKLWVLTKNCTASCGNLGDHDQNLWIFDITSMIFTKFECLSVSRGWEVMFWHPIMEERNNVCHTTHLVKVFKVVQQKNNCNRLQLRGK